MDNTKSPREIGPPVITVKMIDEIAKIIECEPDKIPTWDELAELGAIKLFEEPGHSEGILKNMAEKYGITPEDMTEIRWAVKQVLLATEEVVDFHNYGEALKE